MAVIPDYKLRIEEFRHLIIQIDYTGKDNERRIRKIIPTGIRHTDHVPAEWILDAYDVEQKAFKSYLFTRINAFIT
jgi:predicted DNA-binding transcriptional regulator YafY